MSLVYLDTSQIHLLSKERVQNKERFSNFLKMWKDNHCVLALSRIHLFEICRYDDPAMRQLRYRLFEDLVPLRCEFEFLEHREIILALSRDSEMSRIYGLAPEACAMFSESVNARTDVQLVEQLIESALFRQVCDAFYETSRAGAMANSRERGTKYERHSLSQIGDARPSEDQRMSFLREWEKHRPDISQYGALAELVTQEAMDHISDAIRDMALQMYDRGEEVGMGNALADFFGVDANNQTVSRTPTDLLSQQYAFNFMVRSAVESFGPQTDAAIDVAANRVRVENCPGTWLKYSVEIQIRKALALDEPSNLFDLDHLSHLPYVDLLFTDKRIREFTRQVLNSSNLPTSLCNVGLPIAVKNTIDDVESALISQMTGSAAEKI